MQDRRRTVAVASLVVAGAVAVGGVTGLALRPAPVSTAPSPSPATGAQEAGAPNAPNGSATGTSKGREGTKTDSPGSPTATAAPSAPGQGGGVEVIPETPGSNPDRLPGLRTPSAAALPDWEGLGDRSVAARGHLVPGYPIQLLPLAPRAAVVTSSLAPSPDRVQVALVARRDQSAAAVLRFYRAALARAGFTEESARGVGGSSTAAFTRGPNSVVVTVDPGGAGTYSVYAALSIGKA